MTYEILATLRCLNNNIGHSPALDVRTDSFDAGAFILDFDKHSLIEVGHTKTLNPKGRGKDTLSEGLIQAVRDPGFTPDALATRDSNLELLLNISYKNIEQINYRTIVTINKGGVEIKNTERINS